MRLMNSTPDPRFVQVDLNKNAQLQALANEISSYTKKLNAIRDEYEAEKKKIAAGMDAMLASYAKRLSDIQAEILEKKKEL